MKIVLAVLILVALPHSAAAQECSGIAEAIAKLECLLERTRARTAERLCAAEADEASRAQCYLALGIERSMDDLCNTDALKSDRVACLERKVEVLASQLTHLRRDLPRLIEQGVKAALAPRVFRNTAPEAK